MKKLLKRLFFGLLIFGILFTSIPSESQAAVEISYNGHTYLYQDIMPTIVYGGKTISLTDTPALIMDNVAMVPYYDVFVSNGPKATKVGYSNATKQLVLSLNGTRIVMTLNSTTAYVNGVKKTLPVAPVSVTYKGSNKTRILVPSRAICSYWGIGYTWTKSTRTVSMTAPVSANNSNTVTYYKNSKAYSAKKCSVVYEGTTLSLSKTPALTINSCNMVPYYTALYKQGPKVRKSYSSKTGTIRLAYHSNILTMKIGSKTADLNGETVKLSTAPLKIKYSKKGSTYIMVPIKSVSLYLGISYKYTSSTRTVTLEDGLSIKYDGKYVSYTGKQNTIYVGSTKVSSTMPSINIDGIPYIPAYYVCQSKYGLGVSYSYKSKQATLDTGFHKIILTMGSSSVNVDGTAKTMSAKARLVRLTKKKKNYVMVPAQFVCEALNISYSYSGSTIKLTPSEDSGVDTSIPTSVNTTYSDTLSNYASKQKAQNDSLGYYKTTTLTQYSNYIDPSKDTTDKFQFLRLDTYRPINASALATLLSSSSAKGGVLEGKSSAIINAAKRYKLDPVYFTSQCIHETGWGKSTLAMGITSDTVASPIFDSNGEVSGFKKDSSGNYVTQKLLKKYTAYNLFGIKAYDDAAQLCGFSYAYYNNWFTVDAAIEGGAKYLSDNYVHSSTNNQNTIYKLRFHPTNLNHQYATDPAYATKTAAYIKEYKYLYSSTAVFQYEYPAFK
ncbi:MAG: stalk domain-containing protein [Lachnospiraceae bacterium]|nr:stalk domain-containing protein [Lachnospiraceae bacterium]